MLTKQPMDQSAAWLIIRRRAAGIHAQIRNHTFRATGITAYLENGGQLEHAQTMAMDEGRKDQLVFFAFDLLFLNGVSTVQLPLFERKERLQGLFKKEINGLRYSSTLPVTVLASACGLPPESGGRHLQAGGLALMHQATADLG